MSIDWSKCCDFGVVGRVLLHTISFGFAAVVTFASVGGALGEGNCVDSTQIPARMRQGGAEARIALDNEQCECDRDASSIWRRPEHSFQRRHHQPDGVELLLQ